MKGHRTFHRDFSFSVQLPANLEHLEREHFLICRIPLESLYSRLVTKSSGNFVRHALRKLSRTPHFRFVQGDRANYQDYLERYGITVGYGAEHSVDAFESLLSTKVAYLEPPFASHYIICEKVKTLFGEKTVIIDGVHRACQLLFQGVKSVPIAILVNNQTDRLAQFDRYLADYRDDFLEWYTPLDIEGRVIHERTYPHYKERPEFMDNCERGMSKWKFIIEKNLPDLRGKSVCDIGCNCGLFAVYMSKCGARRVIGYDRSEHVVQPTNTKLPSQNVVEQAYFVKNLFSLSGTTHLEGVEFIECDLNILNFSTLRHDIFFSCCVLYHFGDRFEEIIRAIHQNIPEVFLQTNLGHKGTLLAKFASVDYHRELLEKYGYSVRVDAPAGYDYPVVIGKKRL